MSAAQVHQLRDKMQLLRLQEKQVFAMNRTHDAVMCRGERDATASPPSLRVVPVLFHFLASLENLNEF